MSFKRVIFLILAVFAVYHAFVTPLPADSDVSYRMGALTANVLLPVLLLYFAFKKGVFGFYGGKGLINHPSPNS